MSVECTFDEDVEVQQIIEKTMDFDYIWMVYENLDLEFSYQLVNHVVFSELTLGHYFDCTDHSALLFSCQHYSTECSFP